jgi:hypothetical protein
MKYPFHEGWSRAGLQYLRDECLEPALAFKPDIILLYAGAEDLRDIPDAGIAVARYQKMVRAVNEALPACSIICSQLITNRDYHAEHKVKKFNTGLGTFVEKAAKKNLPISRIKMHSIVKDEGINDLGMPNGGGYSDMSLAWFHAIEEIYRRSIEQQ